MARVPVRRISAVPVLLTGLVAALVALASAALDLPIAAQAGLVFGAVAAAVALAGRREHGPEGRSSDDSRQLAALLEGSPDAHVCYSDSGIIRYANDRARTLFFAGEDPKNLNFLQLIDGAPPVLREALLGSDDRIFTVEFDGWPESYHLTRRRIPWAADLHTLLVVRRVTHQVSKRDVAVSRRVVRLISHEINNSLSPIGSLVHTAERLLERHGAPDERVRQALSTIGERARHLGTFIQAYAELARLPEPSAARRSYEGLANSLRTLYPSIAVTGDLAHEAYFDAVLMEQVLVNLLKNALEAGSSEAGITLHVEVRDDGTSELTVSDAGHGLTDEARTQALLPLYTTKPTGSGLGLTLCREIVEGHGGSLGLSNGSSGGAVVRVVLPGPDAGPDAELSRSQLSLTRG